MIATAADGTELHVEVTGTGPTILFLHEFAGDHRSWEPQVRHLSSRYRCVTYAARGYEPSGVPTDAAAYSQQIAVTDALAVLDTVGAQWAHLVGLSMGGFCALHLGIRYPERCGSLTVAGVGYGAVPGQEAEFRAEAEAAAAGFRADPQSAAQRYAHGPTRVQYREKNPRGWREFAAVLAGHDGVGLANTLAGVQARRPSLTGLTAELAAVEVPVLLVSGDEDDGCLEANLMLKRTMPSAAWAVLPRTGHTINLEEPAEFNRLVDDFLDEIGVGSWRGRHPDSLGRGIVGMVD
ncbi:alpha/beta hydrolase [Kribbella sancticallisti]|uniref:Alpha/beta hydrolase n=1 Tax=Kribbella sancticallisti TaxID=460087 RepID=A0ABN2ELD9_9ACTN